MYTYAWFTLLYGRNQHNMVNNYSPIKKNEKNIAQKYSAHKKAVCTFCIFDLYVALPWTQQLQMKTDTTVLYQQLKTRRGIALSALIFCSSDELFVKLWALTNSITSLNLNLHDGCILRKCNVE